MIEDVAVGRRIRQLRHAEGWSQTDLRSRLSSHGMNWSQSTLSKIESGERSVRAGEAMILMGVFGLNSLEDLLRDVNEWDSATPPIERAISECEIEIRQLTQRISDLQEALATAARLREVHTDVPESFRKRLGSLGLYKHPTHPRLA